MNKIANQRQSKLRRAARVRSKIFGTAARPRLSVFKSNRYIYVQIINDELGKTLVSAHAKELKAKMTKTEAAMALGKKLAEKAKESKISSVVFDRGSNLYHGRIKALADGAREGGLEF